MDLAVPGNNITEEQELEKVTKYEDLKIEVKLWERKQY